MSAASAGYPKRLSTNIRRSLAEWDFRCPQAEGFGRRERKLKKLMAETMLDKAILKDVASKNGDARCEAGRCGSCLHAAWGEPALGVRGFVR
jgi:hypothetical protein